MKLRLRKDWTIPAGTEFDSADMPKSTTWGEGTVTHSEAIGPNATARIFVGAEPGDAGFDEWFEQVPEPAPTKRRVARS